MAQDLVLLSPEKTVLSFRLAGLGTRVLAHLLDLFIYYCAIYIVFMAISVFMIAAPWIQDLYAPLLLLSIGLGFLLYFTLLEWLWNGQTIGKKAVGIRVRSQDGTPVTFSGALGRNLLRFADMLPSMYFLGVLAMFTNSRSQRIGDLVAGTIVVHDRRAVPRFTPAPHAVQTHPLELVVGELSGMTIEEYAALRRFCDRYPELPPQAQRRFVKEVWQPIATRRGVPMPPNIHAIYLAEAVVMRYGRIHGLL